MKFKEMYYTEQSDDIQIGDIVFTKDPNKPNDPTKRKKYKVVKLGDDTVDVIDPDVIPKKDKNGEFLLDISTINKDEITEHEPTLSFVGDVDTITHRKRKTRSDIGKRRVKDDSEQLSFF